MEKQIAAVKVVSDENYNLIPLCTAKEQIQLELYEFPLYDRQSLSFDPSASGSYNPKYHPKS